MPAFLLLFLATASCVSARFLAAGAEDLLPPQEFSDEDFQLQQVLEMSRLEHEHKQLSAEPVPDTTFHVVTTGWAYQQERDGVFVFAEKHCEYVHELTRRIRDLGFERISVINYDAYFFEQAEGAQAYSGRPQSVEQAAKVRESVEDIWRIAFAETGFDSSVIQFKGNWEEHDEAVRQQVGDARGDGHTV